MTKRKIPELLAPAGGPMQYIAAVENGADAVYLGGRAFNARMGAGNFDDRQMEEAIDYGHVRGVKSYVTMNTLLTAEELKPALDYGRFLYAIGADAIIVQDLGLGARLREALPDLPLHLSTQASIYNLQGAQAAYRLGFCRVVTARELCLQEIAACCGGEPEIEVFVHGALCMCYSGQCQLSRYIGGRSGNRGSCAQPCRLPYQYSVRETQEEGGRRRQGTSPDYPLSPKDLCLLDELKPLTEAGVASLKIEGRMKSPEYVAVVTALYRKYLDQYAACGSYTVSAADRRDLQQIFNRGGFTSGYFYGDPAETLMCQTLPKHQGVYVGRVKGQKPGTALMEIQPEKSAHLQIGDGVEIHSRRLTGNVVTYLTPGKAGSLWIGDIKGQVRAGDRVYRITEKRLMEAVGKTFRQMTFTSGKFGRKVEVSARFTARAGAPSTLTLVTPRVLTVEEETARAERPRTRATTEAEIKRQLAKTGGTPFKLDENAITVQMDEPLSIPLSGLNALRRKALTQLTAVLIDEGKRKVDRPETKTCRPVDTGRDAPAKDKQGKTPDELQLYFYGIEDYRQFDFDCLPALRRQAPWAARIVALLPAMELLTDADACRMQERRTGVPICAYIPAIAKGQDAWLLAHLDTLAAYSGEQPVYVGNLCWIAPLASLGVQVCGEPGLNLYQQEAFAACHKLGLTEALPSLEANVGVSGRLPLMVTEHLLSPGILTGRKRQFEIRTDRERHKSYVLAKPQREQNAAATGTVYRPAVCFGTGRRVHRIYV